MTFSISDFVTLRVPKFLLIQMPLARRNERKYENKIGLYRMDVAT